MTETFCEEQDEALAERGNVAFTVSPFHGLLTLTPAKAGAATARNRSRTEEKVFMGVLDGELKLSSVDFFARLRMCPIGEGWSVFVNELGCSEPDNTIYAWRRTTQQPLFNAFFGERRGGLSLLPRGFPVEAEDQTGEG